MDSKVLLLLSAALMTASCKFVPSVDQVALQPGQSTTIQIVEYDWYAGRVVPTGGAQVVSSDPGIFTVEQASFRAEDVTLHAVRPGVAYIQSVYPVEQLVTVVVGACPPVGPQPQTTQIKALPGVPVTLEVFTYNPATAVQWSEAKGGAWTPIPGATSNTYVFTPPAIGTYRFRVQYPGNCEDVSTFITVVVAPSHPRIATH